VTDIQGVAQQLDEAARAAAAIPQLPESLTIREAYEVQRQSVARRLARGEKRVGIKMGLTSLTKMMQTGVNDMVCGRLTDGMLIEDGGATSIKRYVNPLVEPELVFLLKRELIGNVTPMQALSAVEAIGPALGITDLRIKSSRLSLTDVVADNCAASGFVVGPWHSPEIDFSNLGIVMSFDGRAQSIGSTAGILGHPLRSLVAAARLAADADEPLQAGWIVMAGAGSEAQALGGGIWVQCEIQHLGRTGFAVTA